MRGWGRRRLTGTRERKMKLRSCGGVGVVVCDDEVVCLDEKIRVLTVLALVWLNITLEVSLQELGGHLA